MQEPARQSPVEQDEGERDHADRAGEAVIVERDPAETVRADEHADAEEQHEARHADSPRDEGRDETGGEQRAGDEDQLTVGHASTMAGADQRQTCAQQRADPR